VLSIARWDDIDVGKLEFWGHAISVFEGIAGVPFQVRNKEDFNPFHFHQVSR
jgi:hypothetical protein